MVEELKQRLNKAEGLALEATTESTQSFWHDYIQALAFAIDTVEYGFLDKYNE